MAKRKKKRIASRGSVNTTILKTLVNGDKYGYEIIKEVEQYSDGKIQLKQPSLYSSLSRFEEKGIVSSYWEDSTIGGRRHYYHLTDKGQQYYKVSILKIKTDEDDDETTENYTQIKDMEVDATISQDHIKSSQNEQIDNDGVKESTQTNINNNENLIESPISLTEIDEKEIPAIFKFEEKHENSSNQDNTPDHVFKSITPLERIINNEILPNQNDNINQINDDNQFVNEITTKEHAWKDLVNRVKDQNKLCSTTSYKKLHYKKPVKTKKVILDKDGIYKLRDQDYSQSPHSLPAKSKIVDNVGKRITGNNFYDSIFGKKEQPESSKELTNEERLKKNQSFEERFNILTQSKLKPIKQEESVVIKQNSPIADKEPEIDYRSKLDILLNSNTTNTNNKQISEPLIEENNLFNYIESEDDDNISFLENETNNLNDEEFEDKFINFDSEDFEIKTENKKYIEEISNFSSNQDSIKISRYDNKSFTNNIESKTFVLINRVKSIFGIILLLLGSLELTASLIFFKNSNMMQDSDLKIFIIGFVIVVLVSLMFILPALFNSREHRLNTYKLKYTEILGILTFLVSLILIYCINSLVGFDLDNFNYFAVELIVPAILAFNFVITPPIYSAIINNKRFYD